MTDRKNTLTDNTLHLLRNCHLDLTLDFVRCIPRTKIEKEARTQAIMAEKEISEAGVFWTYHPDFGEYLRVNKGTDTYATICQMKS